MDTYGNDKEYEGRDNVCLLLDTIEDANDVWLCYSLEGKSLCS